jgi:hypothetical protein
MMRAQSNDPFSDRKLINLALSYWGSAAVGMAARLGFADHLAEEPRTAEELAELTAMEPRFLHRVLRLLAAFEVFYEDGSGKYRLAPTGERLVSTAPCSLRSGVSMLTSDLLWKPAGRLEDTVREGRSCFGKVFGTPFWEHLQANPDVGDLFDKAMVSLSGPLNVEITDTYDFSGIDTVVDVGGGHGSLLRMLLTRNRHLTGVLYDQEQVLSGHLLDHPDLAGRWRVASGSFFGSVPTCGDLYILEHVLHDWSDEHCVQVLTHCRQAMNEHGKVLIAEMIAPPVNTGEMAWTYDMIMMSLVLGQERNREQFEALLHAAGMRLNRIIPTATYNNLSLIEAVSAA